MSGYTTSNDTDRAREALHTIPPDLPRDEWVRAGMAAQAAGLGFEDFNAWSAEGQSYQEADARATWKSFKANGGIGEGTLFLIAIEHGWQPGKSTPGKLRAPRKANTRTRSSNQNVAALWRRCEPVINHPYITAKQGLPDGLAVAHESEPLTIAGHSVAGWLAVPAYPDFETQARGGDPQSLQFIPPPGKGKKLNMKGASMAGASFTVGKPVPGSIAYVVEGIGQAWACHKATGHLGVVAFGWGNVGRVAAGLKWPVVLVPDKGKEAEARKIALELGASVVYMPEDEPDNFGADDYAQREGYEALSALLGRASVPAGDRADTQNKSSTAEAVERLAKLPPLDYDQVRVEEAEKLGVRVAILDQEVKKARGTPEENEAGQALALEPPEPWPDLVNGAELAGDLVSLIHKYVVLTHNEAICVSLWILHSHAHETAAISPLLAITSPQKRCGKTTLLSLLQKLVSLPLPASNITASALFRAVEKWRPTLLIDEADTFLRDSDDLRGVINSGHNRANAFVIRVAGEDLEPRVFSTWAPKAIALIGKLPSTLADRSVMVALKRKKPGEVAETFRIDRTAELEDIPRRCARWVQDHRAELRQADPDVPANLHDRAKDNWRPLLSIADALGGEWPERARSAALELTGEDEDDTAGVMLLTDIQALFAERGDRIGSADLVEYLAQMEERPWPEWRKGKPITQRQIASLLKPFGIKPITVRAGEWRGKGYIQEDFNDAFARYTPFSIRDSVTNQQPRGFQRESIRDTEKFVTDEKPPKTAPDKDCHGVTDRKPETRKVKV